MPLEHGGDRHPRAQILGGGNALSLSLRKNVRLTVTALLCTSAALMGGPAMTATATDVGNVTGSDILGGWQPTAEQQTRSSRKLAVARGWVQLKDGQITSAQFQTLADDFLRTYGPDSLGRSDDSWAPALRYDNVRPVTAPAPPPASVIRGMTSYGQSESYYCGPASGYDILKYQGKSKSAYTDQSLSQGSLANSSHMQTSANGGTSFASGLWATGVNRWREGKSTGYYVQDSTISHGDFQSMLILGVDQKMFMGADTVEIAKGVHYNNHPKNRTIGHWIVTYGYDAHGSWTYFADPSYSIWGTDYGVLSKFHHTSNEFVDRYLQSNGVAW